MFSQKYTAVHDGPLRSSEDSLAEPEKQRLFDSPLAMGLLSRNKLKIWSREGIAWVASGILFLTNMALLAVFLRQKQETGIKPQKAWLPPEISANSQFQFQTLFGEPPNNESETAWNDLMPVGRGFVIINNDTVLPDQPGLDQSIVEQKAMVAVFHQLHCLYMTREGYYSALEGNVDQVSVAHLTHCFDYLRQSIMCFGDTTLEWLPAPPNDIGSTGWGYEHICRDFNAISLWAEEHRLKTTHGIH
ncbi:hypothetical protein N7463_006191 [Penicillium fimorum]|uniref:Oxidase ustYa n=1 Tax=Penicillium fimorum TaxID=1882269 RepID=A0A9X0C5Y1_9EURO|nr:hypothetical protein N7463_006191 [Penicillium fimorum]